MKDKLNPRKIFKKAQDEGYALGAFNVESLEILKAVLGAAQKLKSPVIIETSVGQMKYMGSQVLSQVTKVFRKKLKIPILLNVDHAKTFLQAQEGIQAGYDLIHFDGSLLAKKKNIEILKRITRLAQPKGLLVEGELDHITGSSSPHLNQKIETEQKRGNYTDPQKVQEFVKATGIDTLAVFIGNVHGLYKNPPKLDFERLKKIRENVNCFLSLHGGSGILPQDIRRAVFLGIVKININTELRLTYLVALKKVLLKTKEVAIYKIMPEVIKEVQKVIEEKIKLFGSVNKV